MLSRLALKTRYSTFYKQVSTRSFAASRFEGMQEASYQDNENATYADIDLGTTSKRSKGPALPHFDYTPPKYSGPSFEEMRAMREKYLSPAAKVMFRNPVALVDGKMQYLFDQNGKRYLDFIGGVSTVGIGHCHPRIVSKMKEQLDRVIHVNKIYYND